MYSLHVLGVAESEVDVMLFAKVSNPVPGERTFHSNEQIVQIGFYEPEQRIGIGFALLVCQNIAGRIE